MQERERALNKWLSGIYPQQNIGLIPLAGDASFRRYFRVNLEGATRILMDAPPDKEPVVPFVKIGQTLRAMGLHTPKIYHADYDNGFLLLEDLGDRLFLQSLVSSKADKLYHQAMDALICLQKTPIENASIPKFDAQYMLTQMQLFKTWFLEHWLNMKLTESQRHLLEQTFLTLAQHISQQTYVFMHSDFHSRNLLVLNEQGEQNLGIIDFQDAMIGPYTYDLVSLLKDCYIHWPKATVTQWLEYFYGELDLSNKPNDFKTFLHDFELCGIQRHLKVLGIFARLHLRDRKSAYLEDIPLVWQYLTEALGAIKPMEDLHDFLLTTVEPLHQDKIK